MAGKKSLSDLGALTGQEPEAPAVAETPAAETETVEAPVEAPPAPAEPEAEAEPVAEAKPKRTRRKKADVAVEAAPEAVEAPAAEVAVAEAPAVDTVGEHPGRQQGGAQAAEVGGLHQGGGERRAAEGVGDEREREHRQRAAELADGVADPEHREVAVAGELSVAGHMRTI